MDKTTSTKDSVPTIRFKEDNQMPFSPWKKVYLDSVFKKRLDRNIDSKYRNVLTNSATKGVVNQGDYFDKDIANQENLTNYFVVDVDDFIYNPRISISAPVGPFKRNKIGKGAMSPLYSVLTLKEGDPGFYEYFFETSLWHRYMLKISNFGARHDRMNIRDRDFGKMIIPAPDIKEQMKISRFLNCVDSLIQNLKSQKSIIEAYKQGMMQKIFSQEVRFKDFEGKNFPDWRKVKLGQIFNENVERAGKINYDLLSVTLGKGVIKYDHSKKQDSSSEDKSNYKVVKVGDIAYNTMRMWQGASGVSKYQGIVSPAYTVVSPKNGDSDFFGYLFKMPRTIFDFYRYSQGLTSDTWNIKFNHFSEVEVTIPTSIEEQVQIKNYIETIDKIIAFKARQIKEVETWKKGLLQKMFV